jgi:hypothetical protein
VRPGVGRVGLYAVDEPTPVDGIGVGRDFVGTGCVALGTVLVDLGVAAAVGRALGVAAAPCAGGSDQTEGKQRCQGLVQTTSHPARSLFDDVVAQTATDVAHEVIGGSVTAVTARRQLVGGLFEALWS